MNFHIFPMTPIHLFALSTPSFQPSASNHAPLRVADSPSGASGLPEMRALLCLARLVSAGPEGLAEFRNGRAGRAGHQVLRPRRDLEAQPQQEYLADPADLTKFLEEYRGGRSIVKGTTSWRRCSRELEGRLVLDRCCRMVQTSITGQRRPEDRAMLTKPWKLVFLLLT